MSQQAQSEKNNKPKRTQIKNMRKTNVAIGLRGAMMKNERGEKPTPGLKASLLVELLTRLQLTVMQGTNSKAEEYGTIKMKGTW